MSRQLSAASERRLKQSLLSLNLSQLGRFLKKSQLILLTSQFEKFWILVISHVIHLESLGFREDISSLLIGELIRLAVSSELRLSLEVISKEPIRLWFGHFTPIPLVIAGGWRLRLAGGSGRLWKSPQCICFLEDELFDLGSFTVLVADFFYLFLLICCFSYVFSFLRIYGQCRCWKVGWKL